MLFELSKRAMITGNTAELDEAIRSKIRPYLYNEGAGKWIHCAHLACLRSPHTSHLTPHIPLLIVFFDKTGTEIARNQNNSMLSRSEILN